ncbi:glycosyltransferase [Maritimibacter sp. HL-12]|uniref:glycosyltransferase n=1 Tax=Maritimibacter sp. HL-12 TaxID=1162418 RepID=UPI000A0F0CD6|nr:glycosyltransferase [Maritimibacter sp. HL-12]SMH48620.1 Putative rhamnosyl transferase [Maritimibacter sp. HL-12]
MSEVENSTVNGVQVLGLCRFSVPSKGAFKVHHHHVANRRAFLYEPKRLALRFTWFEHVVLPGIAAQKDPNFKLVVVLGEDMPEPWRSRMLAHVSAIPQLVAEFVPPEDHRKVCADAIARHIDPEAEAVLQFRHDDDDAVSVDFVRRLRRDFRKTRKLFDATGLMAIDYARGINLFDTGGSLTPYPRFEAFLGIAFAVCTRPSDGNHVLDFMHHVIWQSMPVVTQSDAYMWLRGVHGTNDSGGPKPVAHFEADPAELRRVLRQRFRVDLPGFKQALQGWRDEHGEAAE